MPSREKIGDLNCEVVPPFGNGVPQMTVVLCHGFGAPGNDLVAIGEQLQAAVPLLQNTRFIFPAAPLSLDSLGMYGGRAWWPIDMEKLNRAIATGQIRDMRNDYPTEMPDASDMLLGLVETLLRDQGVTPSTLVLGGFSQGAMVSTDVALRMPEAPSLLCVWSGTLICEARWRELAAQRGSLSIVQSHGRQDPILPFEAAVWLHEMLVEFGLEATFVEFMGEHAIPLEALQMFVTALAARLPHDKA